MASTSGCDSEREGPNPFVFPMLRWRNWIAQVVSTDKVGGSNPSRSTIFAPIAQLDRAYGYGP